MLKRLSFAVYAFFSLWMIVQSSRLAVDTIGSPFAGFLPFKNLFVGAFIQPWWQGHDLQLRYNDRVLRVQGETNAPIDTWKKELAQHQNVVADVGNPQRSKTVTLAIAPLAPKDVLSIFGILFLTGTSFLLMGLLAWLIHPSPPGMNAFLVYCLSIGTYLLCAYDFHTTYHLTYLLLCTWVFIAPSIVHVAISFPRPWKKTSRHAWIPYVVSVLLGIPYLYYFERDPFLWKKFELTFAVYTASAYIFWLATVVERALNQKEEPLVRQQCRVILWPMVFAFGLIFILSMLILFADLVVPMHWLAPLCIVFPFSILFAMFRKNLFLVNQLEDLVQERTEQLRKIEGEFYQTSKLASVGLLAAGTAHEIGNAMNVILSNVPILGGYAQTLIGSVAHKSKIDDQELKYMQQDLPELLSSVTRSCQRAMNIINDLKTFARPGQKTRKDSDVSVLVENTLRLLRPEFSPRIKVETTFEKIDSVSVVPEEIQQVLINLLMNAIQAIEGPGAIKVRVYQREHTVITEISDSGVGIAADRLPRIFEPFYTTKKFGSGLGLSVSYGIVQAHGGNLSIESKTSIGTKVTMTLPTEKHV